MGQPLRYAIDLELRHQHLVTVSLTLPDDLSGPVDLVMPTWTPGSYVMRDYVHHVQQIAAADRDGHEVTLTPVGHTGWRVEADTPGGVVVTWELYANDLTVRTNHVDDHHALLVGAATFVVAPACRDRRHEVTIATDLPVWSLFAEDDGVFVADDISHLLDGAFEVGDFPHTTTDVAGVPHRFVWSGHGGRPDLDDIAADVAAIGQAAVDLFDGALPVDQYTFLCVGWDAGGGGLEHRDGSVLMMPVTTFTDESMYAKFQTLIAHEYLHLWNVKRLTPAELVAPDPVAHSHTRLLWVAEGWTAYYDELLAVRAGTWTVSRFLEHLAGQVDRVLERPGTQLQSLEESSYHAWTKQYVHDENSENAGTDYYAHGALVAWYLDLLIRQHRPESAGLDEAFRQLWDRLGGSGRGYTDADVRTAVSTAAGTDLGHVFDAHVAGRDVPDVGELVEVVGLELDHKDPDGGPVPWLGVTTNEDDRGVVLASVRRDGPAWTAGITGGDRLVALDGQVVGRDQLAAVLRGYDPGDEVVLTVVRGPRRLDLRVVLGDPHRPRRLRPVTDPSDRQQATFRLWTGQDLPAR